MRDLASLSAEDFRAAVGSVFEITDGGSEPVGLRLVEVVTLGERPGHRQPFSLRFHGPLTPVLEQVTHRVLHAEIGELELFLGPIASTPEAIVYEAVFA